MGLKDKIQGTSTSIKEQLDYKKEGSKYFKKIIQSKKIVLAKTDTAAILFRKQGNEEEFFKEFDNITKEGYKMMLSEKVTNPVPMVTIIVGYLYFFQHKKYIN